MKRITRVALWSAGTVVLGSVVCVAAFYALLAKDLSGSWPWEQRTPVEYRIPNGYQGWVKLHWGVSGAPPLPKPGKRLVVTFNSQGEAFTSSSPQTGWASDKYFYISQGGSNELPNTGWCKGGMIWGDNLNYSMDPHEQNGKTVYQGNPNNPVETFFVGTEDLYRKTTDPQGTISHPCR